MITLFRPDPDHGSEDHSEEILVRAHHFTLTPALRLAAIKKTARLFRSHRHLVRIRIDLEQDHPTHDQTRLIAKGRIELSGPDLVVTVESDDAYKSLDLLVDRLSRMLRERSRIRADRRNNRPAGAEFRDFLSPGALQRG